MRRLPPTHRRSGGAFTLVELLVVVLVMAALTTFVLPGILSRAERARPEPKPVQTAPRQPLGAVPHLRSGRVRVQLLASELKGKRCHGIDFEGRFVLESSDPQQPSEWTLPLPTGVHGLEDVSFEFQGKGELPPTEGWEVLPGRLVWSGNLVPGEVVEARVQYRARGLHGLEWTLPVAASMSDMTIEVDARQIPGTRLSTSSLEPVSFLEGTYTWRYESLFRARPVALEFPDEATALARVRQMLQFCGLALLLFGAGFWYLTESYRPGHLAHFRWRAFLLLALNYSLFFAFFVVLGYEGLPPWLAVTWASAISLPLLTAHVAAVVNGRFALLSTVPLASLTWGVAITGVYGGENKSYLFLGMAALVVAWLTFTLDRLVAGQEARRRSIEEELMQRLDQSAPVALELEEAIGRAALTMACVDRPGSLELREALEQARQQAMGGLSLHTALQSKCDRMKSSKPGERRDLRVELATTLNGHRERLASSRRSLETAQTTLEERRALVDENADQDHHHSHCLACGQSCPPGRHCVACGTRRPLELACRSCGQVLSLPLHLLSETSSPPSVHCPRCGRNHDQEVA